MRTLKAPEERREEILNTAEALFAAKGYSQSTVQDILQQIGIAKGTFYYYFKSKEEVMDAIIQRTAAADAQKARAIAERIDLTPVQKLLHILFAQKPRPGDGKEGLIAQFHQPGNAEMHQRSFVQSILLLTPVLAGVVEEGNDQQVMDARYPYETVEFLLAAAQMIFDGGLFQLSAAQRAQKSKAFIHIMETLLGTAPGAFDDMAQILAE